MRVRTVGRFLSVLLFGAPCLYAQSGADKQPIRGLVTMGELPFIRNPQAEPNNTFPEANVHPGVYSAVVILAKWSSLESEPG